MHDVGNRNMKNSAAKSRENITEMSGNFTGWRNLNCQLEVVYQHVVWRIKANIYVDDAKCIGVASCGTVAVAFPGTCLPSSSNSSIVSLHFGAA